MEDEVKELRAEIDKLTAEKNMYKSKHDKMRLIEEDDAFFKKAFAAVDKNSDGILSLDEIQKVACKAGIQITEEDMAQFKKIIGCPCRGQLKDKCVYQDFKDYLLKKRKACDDGPSIKGISRASLVCEIDEDGDGNITSTELIRWMRRNNMEVHLGDIKAILNFFNGDEDGNTTLKDIERKISQKDLKSNARKSIKGSRVLKLLETLVSMDARSTQTIAKQRWWQFVKFQRNISIDINNSPVPVMEGGDSVKDVLPGRHRISDIFNFDDLPDVVPRYTEIKDVQWISNNGTGKGVLTFPSDYNTSMKIEIEVGTNAYVSYYGCTITNTRHQDVTLHMRHAIQDFKYSQSYLQDYILNPNGMNGAGLERHDFSHVDCPIDRDNGVLILAKFVDYEETILHITGFRIPQRHCILIPGNTIHINDYLKGKWRTMLSDAIPVDYVFLEKDAKKFSFEFAL